MNPLSRKEIVAADTLREVAESRMAEAKTLLAANHHAGAVYLAGYGVECYLKLAICHRLRWSHLLGTFKVHDLEGLMLYSGLNALIEQKENFGVKESWAKILAIWTIEGYDSIRYRKPSGMDELTARSFIRCIEDKQAGVVPWLQKMIA